MVVFGSLFLQQFAAYWDYDLVRFKTTLSLQMSDMNTLTGAYIGNSTILNTNSPFTALYGGQTQFPINIDEFHYKTTIGVSLGFQGQSQFQVSLLGQYVFTYDAECLTGTPGTLQRSCELEPILAQNYFNGTFYNEKDSYPASMYAGYNTSGKIYTASACASNSEYPYFCTIQNTDFYVADTVYSDEWNYGSQAAAGTFPMGKNSPVWAILQSPPTMRKFDVSMTNYNKWTWAEPSYVQTTSSSYMTVGAFDTNYTTAMTHVDIAPKTIGGHLFALNEFSFGAYNATNGSEYFEDINNWSTNSLEYGLNANSSMLALNFRGLGLPTTSFNKFANYLSVITKGESTCLSRQSGYCALSSPCDYYRTTGLWDYSFKMRFANQDGSDTYFRVPLATFAANYDQLGGVCVIFVEYLDFQYQDSKQIILGSMFFQSVYAQYSVYDNAVLLSLYKNVNALSSTYIG